VRSCEARGDAQRGKSYGPAGDLPVIILAHEEAKTADEQRLVKLIREANLPRECIPTAHLNSPVVWEALLEKMPLTALTRSLAKMTAVGLLKPLSAAAKLVADKLGDGEYIKRSRLHPLSILLALKTYAQGHGDKGNLTWTPVSTVNDALDAAFYLAFGNVEPAEKRTLMGLDVSGSMSATIVGTSLSCAEASAAMAMIQAKTELRYQLMAFNQGMQPLDISRATRLSDVLAKTRNVNFGGTDCSLPMLLAMEQGWEVDTFSVYTDSETWAGTDSTLSGAGTLP
jgi:60 kDa SS-A/Ro ribonucleoprotein